MKPFTLNANGDRGDRPLTPFATMQLEYFGPLCNEGEVLEATIVITIDSINHVFRFNLLDFGYRSFVVYLIMKLLLGEPERPSVKGAKFDQFYNASQELHEILKDAMQPYIRAKGGRA